VLGKLFFKCNLLQLLVTIVKSIFTLLVTKNKVTCYNYNYISKVTKLLICYIHYLAAKYVINSTQILHHAVFKM